MAASDKTIEQVPNLAKLDIDKANDLIPIFDKSASETKNVKVNDILPEAFPDDGEQGEFLILGGEFFEITNVVKELEPGIAILSVTPQTGASITPSSGSIVPNGSDSILQLVFDNPIGSYGTSEVFYLDGITGLSYNTKGINVGTWYDENTLDIIFYGVVITGTPVIGANKVFHVTGLNITTNGAHGFSNYQTIGIRNAVGLAELLNATHTVNLVTGQTSFRLNSLNPQPIGVQAHTYTPSSGIAYVPGQTTKVQITTAGVTDLAINDDIYIDYDQRVLGFLSPLFGKYTVENVLSQTSFLVDIGQTLGVGTFASGGPLQVLKYPKFNFYYNGNKTVEVLRSDGKLFAHSTINGAITEAYRAGGVVLVHPNTNNYNESIVLKNGVDLYFDPCDIIYNASSALPLMTDNGAAVECNIFGNASFKTTGANYSTSLLNFFNRSSKININCHDILIEIAGNSSSFLVSAYVDTFNLNAQKLYNNKSLGVTVDCATRYNIKFDTLTTGTVGNYTSGHGALYTYGDGVVEGNEIRINNGGHAYSHRRGKCVAYIKKIYATYNDPNKAVSAVASLTHQCWNDCELYLYFDEIKHFPSLNNVSPQVCIEFGGKKFGFYGREITSAGDSGIAITRTGNYFINDYDNPGDPTGTISVGSVYSPNWSAIAINNRAPVLIENTNISALCTAGVPWAALAIGYSNPANVRLINSTVQQLRNNSACHGVKILNNDGTVTMSNVAVEMPAGTTAHAIFADEANTVVKINNPIWLSNFANSNTSIINPGITIQ